MSKPRKLPQAFVTFVVQPTVDFRPTNWQQSPTRFRILKHQGSKQFLGQADAWKFLFNQEVLKHQPAGSIDQWAIHLCLDDAEQLRWFQRQVEGFGLQRFQSSSDGSLNEGGSNSRYGAKSISSGIPSVSPVQRNLIKA